MSDIVEWLREMQDEYEGSGTVIDYHGHYKAAGDRIEELEAALRGVCDRYVIIDDPEKCAAAMDAIARKALGEGKP